MLACMSWHVHQLYAWLVIFFHAAYARCIANPTLPTGPTLTQNNPIAVVSGKADYRLTFDIVPTAIEEGWGSIVHFTTISNCCEFGSRSPAIWFYPGTTKMHVRIGDSTDGNWGLDTDALNLNALTKVTLECNGKSVKLTVGATVYSATQPTHRFAGNLIVYAGDPWHAPAKAVISNLDYKILPVAAARAKAGNILYDST